MTDREDDTIGQLAEDILRRLKALGSFATIELKELVEEAQILIPRDEMDRLLNTYVISDYHYRLLTGPPPLPLVVTPADTQKPPKRHCRACLQINCPDFLNAHQHNAEPSHRCADCFRDFFGETCLAAHLGKPTHVHQQSICFLWRRCEECFKTEVGLQNIRLHRCGYVDCPSCHKYIDAETHRSYIQRALTPQEIRDLEKKGRKRLRQCRQQNTMDA